MDLMTIIREKHTDFVDLCRSHRVDKIYAFGSSITDHFDENKSDIYKILPNEYVPTTVSVRVGDDYSSVLETSGLKYPLIIKPNVGYKGYKVVKVDKEYHLKNFLDLQDERREWLVQEYVSYNCEYSLLFYRNPLNGKAGISSLIEKIYPSVTGDGKKNLRTLVDEYFNPFLNRELLNERTTDESWVSVPKAGSKIILDTIGNYSRGAKFLSLMDKVDDRLIKATSGHFEKVEGLDFFRLDFKADSLEDYSNGNFGILEVNGAKSEPLHIYDPRYGFTQRMKIIIDHWSIIRSIVRARMKIGNYRFPSTRYGLKSLFAIKKLVK